jgi:hypothetical protein
MPMLADIDDPRPSRLRGFLIGAAVALPIGLGIWWAASEWLPGMILGNVVEYDARLRNEDAYMQGVCTNMQLPRDKSLCECVLAVEYPALDCRLPFMHWSLQRMTETCADPAVFGQSLKFCSCVRALDERLGTLESGSKEARTTVQNYAGCTEFDDQLYLPQLEQLE